MFQNFQSISGIEGSGLGESELSMINHNDSISNNQYTIKINAPQGNLSETHAQKIVQTQFKKIGTKNSYTPESTGYDINRQLFSDDDIREAFNIIDINKDGFLTADDLSFFLKCIDQPHTNQEVEEMIRMVSNQGKKVVLDDFKKIGRGKFPTFAAIRHPQPEESLKEQVFQNIKESLLSSMEPEDFFEIKHGLEFSHEKYEEDKARRQDYRQTVFEPLLQENGGLKLRTGDELKNKMIQYSQVKMFNVEKAIQALKELKVQVIQLPELANALSISQQEGRMLFQKGRLSVREAIFDVILFSRGGKLHKLELILKNRSQTLNFEDWVIVLCFMMGSQQRNFIQKRLEGILKHRKIQISAKFDRYFVLQIMTDQYALFLW